MHIAWIQRNRIAREEYRSGDAVQTVVLVKPDRCRRASCGKATVEIVEVELTQDAVTGVATKRDFIAVFGSRGIVKLVATAVRGRNRRVVVNGGRREG